MRDRVGAEFRIGHVLRRVFGVLRRQAVAYSLLCIATSMPGRLLMYFVGQPRGPHALVQIGGGAFDFYYHRFLLLPVFFGSFALMPLGGAMILLATMCELEGKRPVLDGVIRQAAPRYLPLLACTSCGGLAVAGGCLLLIVPGVLVALTLSASGQVCVAERLGPIESFSRSAALTKGNRWRILGFFLVVAAIFFAISVSAHVAETGFGVVGVLPAYFLSGFADAFWATACAVLYVDLRLCREGIGADRIAAVFD